MVQKHTSADRRARQGLGPRSDADLNLYLRATIRRVPARQPEFLGSHLGSHSPVFALTLPTPKSRKPRYFLDLRPMSRVGLEPTTYGFMYDRQ